ncbi:tRNA lysidine(34) synthetase TilS [Kushneria marisflavi]|uniref:tRNA(Ile)-lysidine synthase n=1 Tax=Kushneria marisflavi TaxID=157779 RepID=A0A240UQM1_9GAMM|nr:tRNA lysidine(34) synthetase TilS [Kushneria marisflavi]ART63778.1 tRNA lysidine(34) synthetase TilS [Kushneria marisflavi]RKD85469.1 tRNA(Ile)-lysidine synthase [Kushneria marisflavi]
MTSSLEARIDHAMAALHSRAATSTLWVALSGGRDSTCLLLLAAHAVQRYPGVTLHAVHVHHGLQPAADGFVESAQEACDRLGVVLHVERVRPETRDGLEADARRARYAVFEALLSPGDTLWMAHHRDDQAETLLYRLMRGGGVRGLAGMPARRALGAGWLERPLLETSRADIDARLAETPIAWCDDPTNHDAIQDRNYLRHHVMTPLKARWPAASEQIARSADYLREADELLQVLAEMDLAALGDTPDRLPRTQLCHLSRPRQRLVIEAALRRLALTLPPRGRLETLLDQLAGAGQDRRMCVDWPGAQARLWRGELLLLPENEARVSEISWPLDWDGQTPINTPLGIVHDRLTPMTGGQPALTLVSRVGGERLRLHGQRRPLKKLLQEQGIPPWQRDRVVVVWHGETPVGVLGPLRLAADGWTLEGPEHPEGSGRVDPE